MFADKNTTQLQLPPPLLTILRPLRVCARANACISCAVIRPIGVVAGTTPSRCSDSAMSLLINTLGYTALHLSLKFILLGPKTRKNVHTRKLNISVDPGSREGAMRECARGEGAIAITLLFSTTASCTPVDLTSRESHFSSQMSITNQSTSR